MVNQKQLNAKFNELESLLKEDPVGRNIQQIKRELKKQLKTATESLNRSE